MLTRFDPSKLVPAYYACINAGLTGAMAEIKAALKSRCDIDMDAPPPPVPAAA
jgi:hypothetical protein